MILLPVGCEKGQSERRKARVKETRKEATVMIQARETLRSGGNIKMPQLSYLLIPPSTHSTKRTLNLKVFCSWQCRKAQHLFLEQSVAKSASVQTSSHQSTLGCRPTSMSELTAKFHAHPLNLLSARPLSSVRMGPCSQPAWEHFGIASNNAEVTIFLFLGRCGQSHGNAGFFFP